MCALPTGRLREWARVILAILVAAAIYGLVYRHHARQEALPSELIALLREEIIDLHWRRLLDAGIDVADWNWARLQRQVAFRHITAKVARRGYRVRVCIQTHPDVTNPPAQRLYYTITPNDHGEWVVAPSASRIPFFIF